MDIKQFCLLHFEWPVILFAAKLYNVIPKCETNKNKVHLMPNISFKTSLNWLFISWMGKMI